MAQRCNESMRYQGAMQDQAGGSTQGDRHRGLYSWFKAPQLGDEPVKQLDKTVKYFDLFFKMAIPGRWILADPVDERGDEINPWQFEEGRALNLRGTIRFNQAHPGHALDYTVSPLGVPVVRERVVSIFKRLKLQDQVQFFPAQVEGQTDPYFAMNVLRAIRCIDDTRCEEVRYWKPEDGSPERVGDYSNVVGMRIDKSKVGDAHIFRTAGWWGEIIVSEILKDAMEGEGITGTKFTEV